MIINKSAIKKIFKDSGKRVPRNFMTALDSLVEDIAKHCAGTGATPTIATVQTIANNKPVYGRHFSEALKHLHKNGQAVRLEEVHATAQKIANKELL